MIAVSRQQSQRRGKPPVLIVDDEPDLLELVSLTLSRMNLQTAHRADRRHARGGC